MRLLVILAFAALSATFPARAATPAYDVSGVVVHQCSCPYACPCMFENGPDDCALAAVYHFDHGSYEGTPIDGLSMISIDGAVDAHRKSTHGADAACCGQPKNAKTNPSPGVIYLDMRASSGQRQALLALLQAHGEWPGPGRPVRFVQIQFAQTSSGYSVRVPDRFQGVAKQVFSRKGAILTVDGVGFAEGAHWIVGRSVVNDLDDSEFGLHWHLPNTNGSWSLLHWASPERVSSEKTSFAHSSH